MHCGLSQLGEVAAALGIDLADNPGVAFDPAIPVGRITTDSRAILSSELFVALCGEHYDAHQFVAQARAAGAVAAVVERPLNDPLPQLVVPDTRLALGLLGQARRRAWGEETAGKLVAVTGNSGKTTVKELLATLLSSVRPTLATHGNLNNDIGAPLTLLELASQHRYAVVELGANHLGEIGWTTTLAAPDVAIITNVTGAHVGEFGGLGQIAQAKAEILWGLGGNGIAVLNYDDRFYPLWRRLAGEREVIDFAIGSPHARLSAEALVCDEQGRYAFTLLFDGRELGRVQLALIGRHNVANALAAAAAALAVGLEAEVLPAGLAVAAPIPGRMTVVEGLRGARLIDDTYNANPGAVKAALDTLADMPGPRWCLLGAMGELGEASARLHADVGRHARELGVDFLGTTGAAAQEAAKAYGSAGYHFDDWEALVRHAHNHLPPGASVLVKGSRSAGMERVIAALRADASR